MSRSIILSLVFVWSFLGYQPLAIAKSAQLFPFHQLMMKPPDPLSSNDAEDLARIEREYTKNIDYLFGPSLHHIPKVLHFIWIGPKEFPPNSSVNLESWRHFHPRWRIIFWTDSKSRPLPIAGMERRLIQKYDFEQLTPLIASTNSPAEKADLIRYMILYKEGGIYADHDVLALRSLSGFASHYDFVVGLEWFNFHPGMNSSLCPCNALIISRPKHPVLEATISRLVQCWDEIGRRFPGQDPDAVLRRVIARTFDSMAISAKRYCNLQGNRDLILPHSYFYPSPAFDKDTTEELRRQGYVYAIHKYGGTWK